MSCYEKAETLAANEDPNGRDRSVGLDGIGDVRVAQGDLAGALAAFEEGLEIRQGLLSRDPGNVGWSRDVSVSLNKVGDVRVAQGDLGGALAAFEECLEIARDLLSRDPGNAGWLRDVVVSYWKMAGADPGNAAAHWGEVVSRLEDMVARGILFPRDAHLLDVAREQLAAQQSSRKRARPWWRALWRA